MRLDQALLERGLISSRARARAAIEAGLVRVNGEVITKAAKLVGSEDDLVAREAHSFVGRGALKLDHALKLWPVEVSGKTALDVGASTGGFTEVLLLKGAAKVYAVDVGRDQLHARLKSDPRVVSMEGTDARGLDRALIPDPIDLVVCDASFISLTKILPAALDLLVPGGAVIALIKPQFEAGRDHVGRRGLVKDQEIHDRVIEEVRAFFTKSGFDDLKLAESPIEGGDGNREYLIFGTKRQAALK